MSDVDTLLPEQVPYRDLPTGDLVKVWRDQTEGLKDLTYGDRLPSARGYQQPHDHGQWGGVHLGLSIERYLFGPYRRLRGDIDPGKLLAPPHFVGQSFVSGRAKLVEVVPARIIGGVTQVHIDVWLLPEFGGVSPQALTLGAILRPIGRNNYNEFLGSIAESAYTQGHLKKLGLVLTPGQKRARFTFTDLSRLGPATSHRMVELAFFLMSDLGTNNIVHLLSASILVAAVTTDVTPAQPSYLADQEITPAQVLAGQPLSAGLGAQAKARGNALALSVVGGQPGYVGGQVHPARPFVAQLFGAHQHTGVEIRESDGTLSSDGALLPYSLFAQGYSQLDEDGADEFRDADPPTGFLTSRSGVIGEEATFFQSVPLAAGAKALQFQFALLPGTSSPKTRLTVAVHLCREGVAPTPTNNQIATIAGGGSTDANGYRFITIQPNEDPGYQQSAPRLAGGLGLWTLDAKQAAVFTPDGVVLTNAYRTSPEIELRLSTDARITESYVLRYRFALYNSPAETTLDPDAGLIWAHAYATEG